ncbi:uncharacterized protein LAJ45_09620 [Morchella importuna]|uniref:uncharacterized protein n=1 Tax=Morchella importuna TaxID=1174673 RepID=UPI001E8D4FA8|nr:uncharacterized protein LAJ45_09620 [Morchella importuna]KAH8146427.1 hypothetical protein LAJ45_09620 [Morchella importuna]
MAYTFLRADVLTTVLSSVPKEEIAIVPRTATRNTSASVDVRTIVLEIVLMGKPVSVHCNVMRNMHALLTCSYYHFVAAVYVYVCIVDKRIRFGGWV